MHTLEVKIFVQGESAYQIGGIRTVDRMDERTLEGLPPDVVPLDAVIVGVTTAVEERRDVSIETCGLPEGTTVTVFGVTAVVCSVVGEDDEATLLLDIGTVEVRVTAVAAGIVAVPGREESESLMDGDPVILVAKVLLDDALIEVCVPPEMVSTCCVEVFVAEIANGIVVDVGLTKVPVEATNGICE